MKILAIETSCDETSVAIVERQESAHFVTVLAEATATSLPEHAQTGGIIPENAARKQLEFILPTLQKVLDDYANQNSLSYKHVHEIVKREIDAIAVTYGPGLIGSLLVGVETAKTLSFVLNKPLLPVNHLIAHLYANFINSENENVKKIQFPFIGLIVSGGHTDLLLFTSHTSYSWLGGTRDDAAGEAFDKVGRLLELPYPGGPEIERRARNVSDASISFTSPLLHSKDYDFSFSGLKTEALRCVRKEKKLTDGFVDAVSYALQKAIVDVLVKKTLCAAHEHNAPTVLIGGGVAANSVLTHCFNDGLSSSKLDVEILFPERKYCTDNAAMIGAYAAFCNTATDWHSVKADPEVYFS